ncbi:MAG: dTMP kinase [Kiritimatiellae bacterium]|nr:dTMP kinase [Kiritimatiellia bacterium]MBR4476435.1 dTMP kinase [Kiritimatiellia bacterium]
MRGRFVTFEGGEGCGKSTQVKRLAEHLRSKGVEVVLTREPGGTRLAELIRGLLKDEREDPPCDRSELLLFLAARAQLVRNVIVPALDSGKWVLSDRFSDSTFAYQGYGRGLPLDSLRLMNCFACEGLKPDLTLLLDVRPDVAAARMRRREAATNTSADRIELAGDDFHSRLRAGFLELAKAEPDRMKVIDANGSPDEVWAQILQNMV